MTPHTSVAIFISTRVSHPLLAFLLGLIFHFLLDIIPHGDEEISINRKEKKLGPWYFYKIIIVDALVSGLLIFLFVNSQAIYNKWTLMAALLGSWLPDLAWNTIEIFKIKFLYWYPKLHTKIHYLLGWKISLVYGLPVQIMITLLALKLAF
jgi:hypothetical protein